MKRVLIVFGALCVLCFAAFAVLASLTTRARPVPNAVPGHVELRLDVAHRDVALPVHVFYPTQDTSVAPVLFGQNALFYGIHVRPGAMPLAGDLPVVVMSHGSGGDVQKMGWLARQIANAGAIVVAANHPGSTSGDSDPHQTVKVWERPLDMTAMLDAIAQDPPQGLQPDMTRVGAVGFSFGGYAVQGLSGVPVSKSAFIDYCTEYAGILDCGWYGEAGVDFAAIDQTAYEGDYRDPRVVATVAIDPALPRAIRYGDLDKFTAQTLVINLGDQGAVPVGLLSDRLSQAADNADFALIPGSRHFSFLTECSVTGRIVIGIAGDDNICSDRGVRPRAEVHVDIADLTLSHLEAQLGLARTSD